MRPDAIERYLENGAELGYVKQTDSQDYVGWILFSKRKPPPVGPFDPELEPESHASWSEWAARTREKPYHVLVLELRLDVHDSGDYPENEDYRLRENYYLGSLDEVTELLR